MPDNTPDPEASTTPSHCPVIACTIVARNYLPAARVLAQSYLEHHPDHRFVIALIDAVPADADVGERAAGYTLVGPDAFAIDAEDYLRMATAYSLTELATAVKPFLLLGLRDSADVVVFLDPDIRVFAPMPELASLSLEHQLVLAPHILRPIPRDGYEPDESVIMGTGIFNLGFLATGPGSEEFLRFWATRLRQDAIVAPDAQLFTDQRWVDQVPALFKHHVLRDPGFDVAYWNAHERPLAVNESGALTAADAPLRFVHFSGYHPEQPWLLTYHCARDPRVLLSERPILRRLCDDYADSLYAEGYGKAADADTYRYAALADGTPITAVMRRMFRKEWIEAEQSQTATIRRFDMATHTPPHAFGLDGGAAFAEWLRSAATLQQRNAGMNRISMRIHHIRTDLQVAYPDPCGADAPRFRDWLESSGAEEYGLPEWALPRRPRESDPVPSTEFGVNLLGYLTAEFGHGEMGRIVHHAIAKAGIPVASAVEDTVLSNRTNLRAPVTVGSPFFGVSVLCVNADQTALNLRRHPDLGNDRYRIGLWAWELEDFPAWQHPAFDLVDEVWTVSEFCTRAIAPHSPVPVHTFPVPVDDPGSAVRQRHPGEPVRFLFAFDFNSVGERKNPWGVVQAFRSAFGNGEDVRLTIKAINGARHPHAAERLRVAASDDRRIELLEQYLSPVELDRLYVSSDCYVSLHRSEGFGLTVAEALARGLPVIATDYGGSVEFLDRSEGWIVPHGMTRVPSDCFPYHEGALWADPDLAAAADAMREVFADPAEAARRGSAGRARILSERTQQAAGRWLHERLRDAHGQWLERRQQAPAHTDNPLQPTEDAEQALLWQANVGDSSRMPLAPTARKLVLRAMDHYDVHQRKMLAAVKHGTDEVLATLLARVEALEQRSDASDELLRVYAAALRERGTGDPHD